jgi:hypothetical protein
MMQLRCGHIDSECDYVHGVYLPDLGECVLVCAFHDLFLMYGSSCFSLLLFFLFLFSFFLSFFLTLSTDLSLPTSHKVLLFEHDHHHISSHIITYHHTSSHIITYHHISSHIITYHHISSHIIANNHRHTARKRITSRASGEGRVSGFFVRGDITRAVSVCMCVRAWTCVCVCVGV